jgi:hypothetical protein
VRYPSFGGPARQALLAYVPRLIALACIAGSIVIPLEGRAIDREGVLNVLFIGNSYTNFNDLPGMVQTVSESVPGGPALHAEKDARGGFDLNLHWRRGTDTRRRIARGEFDSIVIQGHSLSAITEPYRLAEYARRFAGEARGGGARVVLFQTWPRRADNAYYRGGDVQSAEEMLGRIDAVYSEIADELDATVAPVGSAWQLAASEVPTTPLYMADGTHPDLAGTYLSACVLYGTIAQRDPRTVEWRPWRMTPRDGERIRSIAAATIVRRAREAERRVAHR